MAEHRLSQHRPPARVVVDDDGRPVRAEVVLVDGVVRIERVADVRRLKRCLQACEDMLRQGRRAS